MLLGISTLFTFLANGGSNTATRPQIFAFCILRLRDYSEIAFHALLLRNNISESIVQADTVHPSF